jgi:hypothetical protein
VSGCVCLRVGVGLFKGSRWSLDGGGNAAVIGSLSQNVMLLWEKMLIVLNMSVWGSCE